MSIGSIPSSHTVVVDWIKLASTHTKKGDIDGYAHLMWLQCLGPAWLGQQVFDTFSRARSFHCYQ